MYTCISIYIYICISSIYIYIYVYIHIYIYIYPDGQVGLLLRDAVLVRDLLQRVHAEDREVPAVLLLYLCIIRFVVCNMFDVRRVFYTTSVAVLPWRRPPDRLVQSRPGVRDLGPLHEALERVVHQRAGPVGVILQVVELTLDLPDIILYHIVIYHSI